jgi:hypothetical protein
MHATHDRVATPAGTCGVSKPRRAQASPLFQLVADHHACAHEYLLAFSCKSRYFCPSATPSWLALWTLWLEETLLEPGFRDF